MRCCRPDGARPPHRSDAEPPATGAGLGAAALILRLRRSSSSARRRASSSALRTASWRLRSSSSARRCSSAARRRRFEEGALALVLLEDLDMRSCSRWIAMPVSRWRGGRRRWCGPGSSRGRAARSRAAARAAPALRRLAGRKLGPRCQHRLSDVDRSLQSRLPPAGARSAPPGQRPPQSPAGRTARQRQTALQPPFHRRGQGLARDGREFARRWVRMTESAGRVAPCDTGVAHSRAPCPPMRRRAPTGSRRAR